MYVGLFCYVLNLKLIVCLLICIWVSGVFVVIIVSICGLGSVVGMVGESFLISVVRLLLCIGVSIVIGSCGWIVCRCSVCCSSCIVVVLWLLIIIIVL